MSYITPELFAFLRELEVNNNRPWFEENKGRYVAVVKEPLLSFIDHFGPFLQDINPHFLAISKAVGGSLFRIYRDVRFSKDKSPYKTQAGVHFRHESTSKDVHAPGYYLHLEPDNVMAGFGLWHPSSTNLRGVRETIVTDPDAWVAATGAAAFSPKGFQLVGDSLKRPPRGYDTDHPLVSDLKRKDYFAMTKLTEAEACAPGFLEYLADLFRAGDPIMAFLCRAVQVTW